MSDNSDLATSSSGSSSVSALELIKEEYTTNCKNTQVGLYELPSGIALDTSILRHITEDLRKQSPLHSSIIDSNYREELLGLIPDTNDREAIIKRLDELAGSMDPTYDIPKW